MTRTHTGALLIIDSPQPRGRLAQSPACAPRGLGVCWSGLAESPPHKEEGVGAGQGSQELSGARRQGEEGSDRTLDWGPSEGLTEVGKEPFSGKTPTSAQLCVQFHRPQVRNF